MKGILKKHNVFSLLVLAEDEDPTTTWLDEQLAYILQGPSHVIVNAFALKNLPAKVVENFVFFEQELLSKNKLLQFVYLDEELKKSSPLINSLKLRANFADALSAFSNNDLSEKMGGKIHFVKAFIDATIRVIFIQSKMLSRRGKISIKTENREKLSGPISGVIKVASTEFPYEIIISFTEECYLNIISAMLGEKQLIINDDNRDGATEILNIIYGQAKLVLNQQNSKIAPQIPVLHIGEEYPKDDNNIFSVPFNSDHGEFTIEVRTPKGADTKKFFG